MKYSRFIQESDIQLKIQNFIKSRFQNFTFFIFLFIFLFLIYILPNASLVLFIFSFINLFDIKSK